MNTVHIEIVTKSGLRKSTERVTNLLINDTDIESIIMGELFFENYWPDGPKAERRSDGGRD